MLQPNNSDSPSIVLTLSSLVGGIRLSRRAGKEGRKEGTATANKANTKIRYSPERQAPPPLRRAGAFAPSAACSHLCDGHSRSLNPAPGEKEAGTRISRIRQEIRVQKCLLSRASLHFCRPWCHFSVSLSFFWGRKGKVPGDLS